MGQLLSLFGATPQKKVYRERLGEKMLREENDRFLHRMFRFRKDSIMVC